MIIAGAVHTTGVNIEGVLANVASITVILGVFGAMLLRSFKRAIKDEIRDVIASEVTPALNVIKDELRSHDTRIARLEGVEQGKRYAVAAASVTTAEGRAAAG